MFYYVPSTTQAYDRMLDLRGTVAFGTFLRNMHRWSAHGMVAIVFLHMCRVFFTGSYKKPREFNWVLGVVLFLLTLFLSFTGYLCRGINWPSGRSRSAPRSPATLPSSARTSSSSCWAMPPSDRKRCSASTCFTSPCCPPSSHS